MSSSSARYLSHLASVRMETKPRLHEVKRLPIDRTTAVDAFFDALKAEHARHLSSIRHACSLLPRDSGQLAQVAATHARLAQQFFDAQRSIMTRRAAVDAEVTNIGRVAEQSALAVVAAARAQAAAGDPHRPTIGQRSVPVVRTVPGDLTAANVSFDPAAGASDGSIIRTSTDTDALAQVINQAFEPGEPDGVVLQRQLTSMLDGWWSAENQEGLAVIDDAHARAAMRGHLARIEAEEIVVAGSDGEDQVEILPTHGEMAQLLPLHMLAALEQADSAGLQSLLMMLTETLTTPCALSPQSQPNERALASRVDDMIIRLDRPSAARPTRGSTTPGVEPGESEAAFLRFWSKGPGLVDSKRRFGWIPMRVVLPMAAATSAFALAMAVIG